MKTKKTVTVKTTQSKCSISETKYVWNSEFGTVIGSKKEYNQDIYGNSPIKLRLYTGNMFPGTEQSWKTYLKECIIDTLYALGMLYRNDNEEFFIKQQLT